MTPYERILSVHDAAAGRPFTAPQRRDMDAARADVLNDRPHAAYGRARECHLSSVVGKLFLRAELWFAVGAARCHQSRASVGGGSSAQNCTRNNMSTRKSVAGLNVQSLSSTASTDP